MLKEVSQWDSYIVHSVDFHEVDVSIKYHGICIAIPPAINSFKCMCIWGWT